MVYVQLPTIFMLEFENLITFRENDIYQMKVESEN